MFNTALPDLLPHFVFTRDVETEELQHQREESIRFGKSFIDKLNAEEKSAAENRVSENLLPTEYEWAERFHLGTNQLNFDQHLRYIQGLESTFSGLTDAQTVENTHNIARAVVDWCNKISHPDPPPEAPVLNQGQVHELYNRQMKVLGQKLPELRDKLGPNRTAERKALNSAIVRLKKLEATLPTCTVRSTLDEPSAAKNEFGGVLTSADVTTTTNAKKRAWIDRRLVPMVSIAGGLVILGTLMYYLTYRSRSKKNSGVQASPVLQTLQTPQAARPPYPQAMQQMSPQATLPLYPQATLPNYPPVQVPRPQNLSPQQYAPALRTSQYNPAYSGGFSPYSPQALGGYAGAMGYGYGGNNPYAPLNLAQYAG